MEFNNPAVLSSLMNPGFTTNIQRLEKTMESIDNVEMKRSVLAALKKIHYL